jgi:hypothetical protein
MHRFQSLEACQQIVKNDIKKIPDKYKNFDEKTRDNKITNPWKRMVVGILSCDRTSKRLASFLAVYKDIFTNLGLDYYIIYADPDIKTEQGLDFVVNDSSRIFTAKAKESYETLAHKVAIFYSYVYNYTDYDYVIKLDDGCLVDLSKVLGRLECPYVGSVLKPTSNKIHKNKCSDKRYNKIDLDFGHNFKELIPDMSDEQYKSLYHIRLAGGGYGYRVSREAIQFIDKYKEHILSLGLSYEDVLFGQIFHLEGIGIAWHGIGRYHNIGPK